MMHIETHIRENDALRHSFNRLAGASFGLDFEPWYQNGYWGDDYIPYALVEEGQIVANVSVNRMDFRLGGETRRYVQLGTVMTAAAYRNQGCCRRLMEAVLDDWAGQDGVFLYANGQVAGMYLHFGFTAVAEHRYRIVPPAPLAQQQGEDQPVLPVSMATAAERAALLDALHRRRDQGVAALHNDGLLLFYLSQSLRDCVYRLPDLDAYAVAEREGNTLTLYAVYAPGEIDLPALCRRLGAALCHTEAAARVNLAFVPANKTGFARYIHWEENSTFFVMGQPLTDDLAVIESFPDLAHA